MKLQRRRNENWGVDLPIDAIETGIFRLHSTHVGTILIDRPLGVTFAVWRLTITELKHLHALLTAFEALASYNCEFDEIEHEDMRQ